VQPPQDTSSPERRVHAGPTTCTPSTFPTTKLDPGTAIASSFVTNLWVPFMCLVTFNVTASLFAIGKFVSDIFNYYQWYHSPFNTSPYQTSHEIILPYVCTYPHTSNLILRKAYSFSPSLLSSPLNPAARTPLRISNNTSSISLSSSLLNTSCGALNK
jgi:hypothetical protein